MVQCQLFTLEDLKNSRFGPFPQHGLQLLFWFARHCVTCELVNAVVVMKLVSDCQPERGSYGFHWFGNAEELLPVLIRRKKSKSKRKGVYFEVGNLNTETYPASANLPTYVRENYMLNGKRGSYNIDRIIISYLVRTKLVETVYVTEHDMSASGKFSSDLTYEISSELIQALQSPLLDLPTFLTQVGYGPVQMYQDNAMGEMYYPEPSAQEVYNNMVQTYSGSTARTEKNNDLQFFSGAFRQQLDVNYGYDQHVHYTANAHSSDVQQSYWRQSYWPYEWDQHYEGFDEEPKKKSGGGGFSFVKLLLSAGALYLAFRCLGWLRSWWKEGSNENVLKMIQMIPQRPPSCKHTHVMLDYVF